MRLGTRALGDGAPAYIAFEIGPTVCGLPSALAMTRAAAKAGADAIKHQILDADRLVGRDVPVTFGTLAGPMTRSMLAILRRRALQPYEWIKLAAEARSLRLDIIATIDDDRTLRLACGLRPVALKICSGDIGHLDWIREVARAGPPVMLDTGSAGLGEIERAVDICHAAGQKNVIVVHCPSGYPARAESINLRMLTTLRQVFPDLVIGFSDHSPGADMDIAAIALGAQYIEKTLCLDRSAPWPEHTMAVEPTEAVDCVRRLRDVEVALGHPRRTLGVAELAAKANARRSAFAKADLLSGLPVLSTLIEWRRPAEGGIEPEVWPAYVQRTLTRAVPKGTQITEEDFA